MILLWPQVVTQAFLWCSFHCWPVYFVMSLMTFVSSEHSYQAFFATICSGSCVFSVFRDVSYNQRRLTSDRCPSGRFFPNRPSAQNNSRVTKKKKENLREVSQDVCAYRGLRSDNAAEFMFSYILNFISLKFARETLLSPGILSSAGTRLC